MPTTSQRRLVRSTFEPQKPTRPLAGTLNIEAIENRPDTSLRDKICLIFEEVQKTNATHRKCFVALRKIQEICCYESLSPHGSATCDNFVEQDFNNEIQRCTLRVFSLKKTEPAGDRVVKFLAAYLKQSMDLDNATYQFGNQQNQTDSPETPTSRLIFQILSLSLQILQSKDKIVRFRSTQIISHLINTLDSIDDEQYFRIRLGLLKRLKDKESNIRVQAVYGLGRLASEMTANDSSGDSGSDGNESALEKLLDMLQNDSSPEVRRSLLLNLPFSSETLPFLLERARDADNNIRKILYSRLLPALGDFRHLSLAHREKLLRWGLRDRDDHVKNAAAKLFQERWISDCASPKIYNQDSDGVALEEVTAPSLEGLLELLERIDVINAGLDGGIALDAMREFWAGRPDYCDFMEFDENFWNNLTPESVFVARTFNDFCRQENDLERLEDKLPEITRLAFLIQRNINVLVDYVAKYTAQAHEGDLVQQEFIVEQLLNIALTLDYSDEMGRRTIFSLMREALSLAELPEECTRLVVCVLRTTCGTTVEAEQQFSAVVLEAIGEVHDTIMVEESMAVGEADESFHSACSELKSDCGSTDLQVTDEDEEKALREIMVNLQCLHISQCMLQNVRYGLEQNLHLVTMLNNLIVPAVRSQEAPIRERGLLCLGLCCLLDKNLAAENLTLFIHCFNKGHEVLQHIAIQIISDITVAHPYIILKSRTEAASYNAEIDDGDVLHKSVNKVLLKGLKSSSTVIQTTSCIAVCKLILSMPLVTEEAQSTLNTDELLRILTIAYFDPGTSSNTALRQALSYFLPVYCHSREENMRRMGRISLQVLDWRIRMKEEYNADCEDEIDSDIVGVNVVINHLIDWTDPHKLANSSHNLDHEEVGINPTSEMQLEMASALLGNILNSCSRDERKPYISMLSKLSISPEMKMDQLLVLKALAVDATDKIPMDATARNNLNKFLLSLERALNYSCPGRSECTTTSVNLSPFEDTEGNLTNEEKEKKTPPQCGDFNNGQPFQKSTDHA